MLSKSNVSVIGAVLTTLSGIYYFMRGGLEFGKNPSYEYSIKANFGSLFKNEIYRTQSGDEVDRDDLIAWLQSDNTNVRSVSGVASYILETENKTLTSTHEISKWYNAWDSIANATISWVEAKDLAESEQKWAETNLHHYDYL